MDTNIHFSKCQMIFKTPALRSKKFKMYSFSRVPFGSIDQSRNKFNVNLKSQIEEIPKEFIPMIQDQPIGVDNITTINGEEVTTVVTIFKKTSHIIIKPFGNWISPKNLFYESDDHLCANRKIVEVVVDLQNIDLEIPFALTIKGKIKYY